MPVTEAEAAALVAGSLDVHDVGDLGGDRRHLNVDWPTGAPQRLNWLHGPFSVMEGY
jgi:hypothetical protein